MTNKEILDQLISEIKENTSQNKWTMFTLPAICSQFNIGNYAARVAIIRLRLDVNLRTRLVRSASRFKPKEFFYGTPKEKIKDIKNGDPIFSINEQENKKLIKIFNEYLNEEHLNTFLILMYIAEKLKSSNLAKKWGQINILEISNILECSEQKVLDYLNYFIKNKILVYSRYTLEYKLTLSTEEYDMAMSEVNKQAVNPNYVAVAEKTETNTTLSDDDTGFDSTDRFKKSISRMINYNAKINSILNSQIRLLDGLILDQKQVSEQKIVVTRLSTEYNNLSAEHEKLKAEYRETKDVLKATDSFIKEYQQNISNKTTQMIAEVTAIFEEYFKQPIHVKNDIVYNNKVKVALTTVMVKYQQDLLQYKRGSNED